MAVVVVPLSIVQAGIETVPGTAVAATRVVDMEGGNASLITDQEPILVANAGSLASGHRAYPGPYKARVEFKDMPANYDDLPWWLNFFCTPVTTGTGVGADKTYTQLPHDTADDAKRATLEIGGRDTWASEFKLAGCSGQKFDLAIKRDGLWRMSSTLLGTLLTKASKTAALSARTVQHIVAAGTKVYLDSASAFGTTQLVGRLISADVSIENGLIQREPVDGHPSDGLAPAALVLTERRKVSAKVVATFDAITEFDAWRAATAQRLRLKQTGPTLGGSAYSAQLDLGGAWKSFGIGDAGGIVTAEMELSGLYDSAIAADWKSVTVNAQATLV